jgi:hypothetical protein
MSLPFPSMLGLALGVLIFVVGFALTMDANKSGLRVWWPGQVVFVIVIAGFVVSIVNEWQGAGWAWVAAVVVLAGALAWWRQVLRQALIEVDHILAERAEEAQLAEEEKSDE